VGHDRVNRRGALLASAALVSLAAPARAQTSATLRAIGPGNDGYKPVYYGMRAGIFQKYGVTVTASVINSGAAAAAALVGGAADVAFTNITTLVTAHNKAIPMQALAPGGVFSSDTKPTAAMLVLKDAPIRSGADLSGKTIGSVALGDTLAASIQAWIDQNGGNSHSVKIIEVPASSIVQMLEDERVSAAVVNEPAVTQALATGKVRALVNTNVAIARTFLSSIFAVMAPAADKNADTMRRFAQAMHESTLYTNAHPADTVDLVASYSGIASDIVAHSARITAAEYIDPALVQPVIDVLVKYGITDHAFPAQDIISPYALRRR
jgi:NitT/TauT family transport system substrate-binding protein